LIITFYNYVIVIAKKTINNINEGLVPICISLGWLSNIYKKNGISETAPEVLTFTRKKQGFLTYDKPLKKKLDHIFKEGRGIILIDGLDEVDVNLRNQFTIWARQQSYMYPKSSIVMTARPSGYLGGIPSFQDFEIRPFNFDQISRFVELWSINSPSDYSQFLPILKGDKRLIELSKTPLFLTFLCILFEKGKIDITDPPIQEYWVCDSYINLMLEQWDADKGSGPIDRAGSPIECSIEEKLILLKGIAFYFFEAEQIVFQKSDLLKKDVKFQNNSPSPSKKFQ